MNFVKSSQIHTNVVISQEIVNNFHQHHLLILLAILVVNTRDVNQTTNKSMIFVKQWQIYTNVAIPQENVNNSHQLLVI